MEKAGILGPPDGSKPRDVLIDFTPLDAVCGVAGGKRVVDVTAVAGDASGLTHSQGVARLQARLRRSV